MAHSLSAAFSRLVRYARRLDNTHHDQGLERHFYATVHQWRVH